ncbi:MAG: septation protein A [Burkholderiaceae bacterium]|nr:septation protein A [Burkholderiaceae bacterium]
MKLLADFLPIILFFIAYQVWDIYVATAVAIAASAMQIAWTLLRGRKVEPMQWTTMLIIAVFGGMTLFFRDETFIKWKPTVVYGLFAIGLLVARYGMGRNLIRTMMEKQVSLPDPIWTSLNWVWVAFFAVMGILNVVVAYTFSTDFWVQFKLFGTLGLTVLFIVAQALWIGRHAEETSQ